jgi:hypothetical protein
MSNSTQPYSTVRITFDPYNHDQVQEFLKQVVKDFGQDKTRWYYKSIVLDDNTDDILNVWVLDFNFRDPHDATMFGLKYLR